MSIKSPMLYFIVLILSGVFTASFPQQMNAKLKQLTTGSDIIITGKVAKQKSSWNSDKTRIYTEATVQVDQYLKGNNQANTVVVNYPGGEVGDVGELYTHMPKFSNNEDVLVFLKKDKKSNSYAVFDGENGKIKIIKDAKTGQKVTSSNVRIDYIKSQIESILQNKK
jgi:hypothetical protein